MPTFIAAPHIAEHTASQKECPKAVLRLSPCVRLTHAAKHRHARQHVTEPLQQPLNFRKVWRGQHDDCGAVHTAGFAVAVTVALAVYMYVCGAETAASKQHATAMHSRELVLELIRGLCTRTTALMDIPRTQ
jgi:hypothetical protein